MIVGDDNYEDDDAHQRNHHQRISGEHGDDNDDGEDDCEDLPTSSPSSSPARVPIQLGTLILKPRVLRSSDYTVIILFQIDSTLMINTDHKILITSQ